MKGITTTKINTMFAFPKLNLR